MSRFDYDVVCIETSAVPEGAAGSKWHRYIIANQITSITGYRSGSRKEVTEHARQCARRLNNQLRNPHPFGSDGVKRG
jgi:hypothetical protein